MYSGVFSKAKPTNNNRSSTAKPAAFDAVDKNPATGVGAPWYTSGAQNWNGTMVTLKPRPTTINAIRPKANNTERSPAAKASPSRYISVVPAKPNTRLKPYNITVDATVPNRKYLKPASVERSS